LCTSKQKFPRKKVSNQLPATGVTTWKIGLTVLNFGPQNQPEQRGVGQWCAISSVMTGISFTNNHVVSECGDGVADENKPLRSVIIKNIQGPRDR
jgi:hypothetical protein